MKFLITQSIQNGWKSSKLLLIILTVLMLASLYFHISMEHANTINTRIQTGDIDHGDQKAHIDAIKKTYEQKFTYLGDRNRMPLYDFIQTIFYTKGMSEESLFRQGKIINILFSLFLIYLIFVFNSKYLSTFSNVVFILIIGFSVFLPKAPYIQPELLYYTLFFMAFVYFCRTIKTRNVFDAIYAGLFAAFAQLSKASMLLGFTLFAGTLLISNFNVKKSSKGLIIPAITILTFLFILAPYLIQTKKLYGKFFFNYATTYAWSDNWNEVLQLERKFRNPDNPISIMDQLPSPSKFLGEHTAIQIGLRILSGLILNIGMLLGSYTSLSSAIMILYLIFLSYLIIAPGGNRDSFRSLILNNKVVILFVLIFFSLYFLAFSWYSPIGAGPRFTLAFYMPILFIIFYLMEQLTIKVKHDKGHLVFNTGLFYLTHILAVFILFLGLKLALLPILSTSWAGF